VGSEMGLRDRFSAVKRWCRERDSGLKFELGAGAKSRVS
jgi:hypothetical protein